MSKQVFFLIPINNPELYFLAVDLDFVINNRGVEEFIIFYKFTDDLHFI